MIIGLEAVLKVLNAWNFGRRAEFRSNFFFEYMLKFLNIVEKNNAAFYNGIPHRFEI